MVAHESPCRALFHIQKAAILKALHTLKGPTATSKATLLMKTVDFAPDVRASAPDSPTSYTWLTAEGRVSVMGGGTLLVGGRVELFGDEMSASSS